MDRSRYPADWPAISQAIRERACGYCEWCGVPNGSYGARDKHGVWRTAHQIDCLNSDAGYALYGEYPHMIRIVLTVAHLSTIRGDGTAGDKHNKMDCRPEALAALCQRCHLNYDRDEHGQHAAETWRRKRLERTLATGQLPLPMEAAHA